MRRSVVNRCSSRRAATLLACLAGVVIAPASWARPAPQGPPAYRQLESFGGPPIGTNPAAGLLQATDGARYGRRTFDAPHERKRTRPVFSS